MSLSLPYIQSGPIHSPLLVFIHGLAETGRIWEPVVELLSDKFCCIQIDLPGHGAAWEQTGSFTMNFYAQAIRQLIEEKKWRSITLVAHSMGAQISTLLALQIQPLIDRLVWIAPAGVETFTDSEASRLVRWTEQTYSMSFSIEQVQTAFSRHFSTVTPQTKILLNDLTLFYQTDRIAAFRKMIVASVKGMLDEPVHDLLPLLQQKVHVMIGTNDQLVPNRSLHPQLQPNTILLEARQKLKHCTTELVSGVGHFLPYERPDLLAKAVKNVYES